MGIALGTCGSLFLVILLCLGLYGCPQYNVYSSRMAGEAELAQAEYGKQVSVQTAKAKADSAELLAQADVTRAKGIAQANKIIADSLGGPEGYLHWKYLETLGESVAAGNKEIIYLPTEAGVPILEAPRLGSVK